MRKNFLLLCLLACLFVPALAVAQDDSAEEDFSRGKTLYGWAKYEKAFPLFLRAAEQGHVGAQFHLGWLYARGQGVARDYEIAVLWYEQAADQGSAVAQYALGEMFIAGKGVEQDAVKGVEWLRQAVAQGNAKAQYRLGTMYRLGIGVEKDEAKAKELYRRAFERGYTPPSSALSRQLLLQQQILGKGTK